MSPRVERRGRWTHTIDDEAANAAIAALAEVNAQFDELSRRRQQLATEASDAGMTNIEIGAAIGVSPSTVGYWIRLQRIASN